METKKTKRVRVKLDDYQLFLISCIAASLVWVYVGSSLCVNALDELLYVLFGVSFPLVSLLVKKLRLLG